MKCVSAFAIVANLLAVFCSGTEVTVGTYEGLPATTTNATTSPANGSSHHIEAMPYNTCMCAQNVDFVGEDFATTRGGPGTCCDQCKRRLECGAYSWTDYQGGTCWLKRRDSQAKVYLGGQGCVIADNPTVESFAQIANCDWPGNDLGYTIKATKNNFGMCESFCWTGRECRAVTWTDYEGGTCWFKRAVTECAYYPGAVSSAMLRF